MIAFPLALLVIGFQKDKEATLGFDYAQILSMGETKWRKAYEAKKGDTTAGMASGLSIYGDALAWRNDHLSKGRVETLRNTLEAFSEALQNVGYAVSEGGTFWNITSGQLHVDLETTLHGVLTKGARPPSRKVSDVTAVMATLRASGKAVADEPWRTQGRKGLAQADAAFSRVLAQAVGVPGGSRTKSWSSAGRRW